MGAAARWELTEVVVLEVVSRAVWVLGLVAGPVGVAERRVGQAVVGLGVNAENVEAPGRVAVEGHRVRVVGGDDDQRVALVRHLVGPSHRRRQLERLVEGDARLRLVVRHVDLAALHEQVEAVPLLAQHLDRLLRHQR